MLGVCLGELDEDVLERRGDVADEHIVESTALQLREEHIVRQRARNESMDRLAEIVALSQPG